MSNVFQAAAALLALGASGRTVSPLGSGGDPLRLLGGVQAAISGVVTNIEPPAEPETTEVSRRTCATSPDVKPRRTPDKHFRSNKLSSPKPTAAEWRAWERRRCVNDVSDPHIAIVICVRTPGVRRRLGEWRRREASVRAPDFIPAQPTAPGSRGIRTGPPPAEPETSGAEKAPVSPAQAIAHAVRLLDGNPLAAERQAREVLRYLPQDARALLVIGAARRRLGDLATARRVLGAVAAAKPDSADAHCELGLALAASGQRQPALAALRRAAALEPDFADAWAALSELLFRAGAAANPAPDAQPRWRAPDSGQGNAVVATRAGKWPEARERWLAHLRAHPEDLGAARLLGETLARLMRYDEAEFLLAHCLRLAPEFTAARRTYAFVLYDLNKPDEAIAQFEKLLESAPGDPQLLSPLAACHVLRMDCDKAIPLLRRLVADHPDDAKIWINYGQSLRIVGDRAGAVAAARRALVADPRSGDAYWSLADLKTGALDDADVAAMAVAVEAADLTEDEGVALHYALGKAYEERRNWARSFAHYSEGARRRRRLLPTDPDRNTASVERLKACFTAAFFEERRGWGDSNARPIFVVGLPRSGSTLIEQILASHSQIEATTELSLIPRAVESFHMGRAEPRRFPATVDGFGREHFARLATQYLAGAAVYRKRDAPMFVDKLPGNLFNVGLIKLMFPNAKVVDVRRDPMGAGFAVYKQYFFRGQNYSYDLGDIGRYYRDYLGMMAHFDKALPGFVHRVRYNDLVDDVEGEARRLLAYLEVDFEDACLNYWRNDRPIATHSSEQVRRPIYRDALDLWRFYEPWLGPLRESLGDALQNWKRGPNSA